MYTERRMKMKYKAEIMFGGRVVKKQVSIYSTHPNQILNRVVSMIPATQFSVYIANESGDVWLYDIINAGRKYKANLRAKNTELLNRDKIHDIFSDNITIKEALR
jgi:hypothetical protein